MPRLGTVIGMAGPAIDVTDATFEAEVLNRSAEVPVVVDLWAPWCGPCRTLGPILEKVIGATDGQVVLAKVDIDQNPRIAQTFRVQSIPAVFALRDRQIVDNFIGALPEHAVQEFVDRLAPSETEVDRLIAAGDEASLREALELEPANEKAVLALAGVLAEGLPSTADEVLALLAKIPETPEARHLAALARTGAAAPSSSEVTNELDALLDRVKEDESARQRFLDLLEVLGPEDERTAKYRKAFSNRLF
jgi:putative thioredoxin